MYVMIPSITRIAGVILKIMITNIVHQTQSIPKNIGHAFKTEYKIKCYGLYSKQKGSKLGNCLYSIPCSLLVVDVLFFDRMTKQGYVVQNIQFHLTSKQLLIGVLQNAHVLVPFLLKLMITMSQNAQILVSFLQKIMIPMFQRSRLFRQRKAILE